MTGLSLFFYSFTRYSSLRAFSLNEKTGSVQDHISTRFFVFFSRISLHIFIRVFFLVFLLENVVVLFRFALSLSFSLRILPVSTPARCLMNGPVDCGDLFSICVCPVSFLFKLKKSQTEKKKTIALKWPRLYNKQSPADLRVLRVDTAADGRRLTRKRVENISAHSTFFSPLSVSRIIYRDYM